jgi:hypothetical protein
VYSRNIDSRFAVEEVTPMEVETSNHPAPPRCNELQIISTYLTRIFCLISMKLQQEKKQRDAALSTHLNIPPTFVQ